MRAEGQNKLSRLCVWREKRRKTVKKQIRQCNILYSHWMVSFCSFCCFFQNGVLRIIGELGGSSPTWNGPHFCNGIVNSFPFGFRTDFFCELLLNGDFEKRSVDNVPVGHLFSGSYSENFFELSRASCLLQGWKPFPWWEKRKILQKNVGHFLIVGHFFTPCITMWISLYSISDLLGDTRKSAI